MRRIIQVATLGALLLTAPACSATGSPATSSPASAAAGPRVTAATTGPATSAPTTAATFAADAAAKADPGSTKAACDALSNVLQENAQPLGVAVDHYVGYTQTHKAAKAKEADAETRAVLRRIAAAVRTRVAAATDPKVRAAAEESATNVQRKAADPNLLSTVRTKEDIGKFFKVEMRLWFTPLGSVCG